MYTEKLSSQLWSVIPIRILPNDYMMLNYKFKAVQFRAISPSS
jgi:hypothetical protein